MIAVVVTVSAVRPRLAYRGYSTICMVVTGVWWWVTHRMRRGAYVNGNAVLQTKRELETANWITVPSPR